MRLFAAAEFCCRDKDFYKNSPVYTTRFVAATRRRDTVASTCRLVGTDLHWSFRWAKILLFYLIYFGSSDSPLNNVNSVSYFWSSCWPLSYKICDTFGKGLSFLFSWFETFRTSKGLPNKTFLQLAVSKRKTRFLTQDVMVWKLLFYPGLI